MTTYDHLKYERLRPNQIVRARKKRALAYLPIGTIEWHGHQNPVGLDTLKIEGICLRCAKKTGGLVFPPLFYGESREHGLLESTSPEEHRFAIHKAYGLPHENFAPGYMRRSVYDQCRAYVDLLIHMLMEIRSLGFEVIVVGAGHYPLLDFARSAISSFHQIQKEMIGARQAVQSVAWTFTGYELIENGFFDVRGDHAGKWETSLMMEIDPSLVDRKDLKHEKSNFNIGRGLDAVESNRKDGRKYLNEIVKRVSKEVDFIFKRINGLRKHGLPSHPSQEGKRLR